MLTVLVLACSFFCETQLCFFQFLGSVSGGHPTGGCLVRIWMIHHAPFSLHAWFSMLSLTQPVPGLCVPQQREDGEWNWYTSAQNLATPVQTPLSPHLTHISPAFLLWPCSVGSWSEVPVGVVGIQVAAGRYSVGVGLLEKGTLGVLFEGLGGFDPPFLGFHTACALGRKVGEDGCLGLHMLYPGPACHASW